MNLDVALPVFSSVSAVEAVYLFGSRAEDRARSDSDFDFAVVASSLSKPGSSELRDKLLTELTRAGFDNLSVVIFSFDDLYLAFQCVKNNFVVYKRDGFDVDSFYSLVVRRYLDFEPYLRRQREEFRNGA